MGRKAKDFKELDKLITKGKRVWKPNTTNKEIPTPARESEKADVPRLSRPAKPNQRKKLVTPKVAIRDYPI